MSDDKQRVYIVADIVEDSERGSTGDYSIGPARKTLEKAQALAVEYATQRYGIYKNLEFSWTPDPDNEHVLILSVTYDTGWQTHEPILGGMKIPIAMGNSITVSAWRTTGHPQRRTIQHCAVVTVEACE